MTYILSIRLVQAMKNKQRKQNKKMKHGKQRAIRKIACRFKNQQNRLLKSLVNANWLVSGAKATCASCILQDSHTSMFKAEGQRIQEDSRENMFHKKGWTSQ